MYVSYCRIEKVVQNAEYKHNTQDVVQSSNKSNFSQCTILKIFKHNEGKFGNPFLFWEKVSWIIEMANRELDQQKW